ncbi:DUF1831 domain-containing protein [Lacticaseibacillus brantae]|uniref:Cysteine desulfurase n=1 Tax=Lacticaseibacillus brantae DSM 23927 TaxID=1423727 RepID=A0A0R2AYX7_9LACO|nr:DUF1831 domain-containing protein [Lacticaseibacillus brantae]KRM72525.1 hypothetical protein FC34_GL000232 [Lacticaseibacillus brantae DSM 23927]
MALAATGKALGDKNTYGISPEIKRYTLMDLGFTQTKNGNFQLERSLDPNSPFTAANKLKVTFSKDLSAFQMSVTTANGLKAINIFTDSKLAENVEQYQYLVDNLIERNVLQKQ